MNRFILTAPLTILFFFLFSLPSCKQKPVEKELWAIVINFLSPDSAYYPVTKNFPFPDSLRFATLEGIFTNQNNKPVISDSSIVFFDNYRENGKRLCCKPDTLEIYVDSISGKKYLFAISDYITVFQSNNTADSNLRTRNPSLSVPFWDIKLNTPYPVEKFKNDYEKLGARYVKIDPRIDEVSRQKWNENDSILVESIQFENSTDRIITAVQRDIQLSQVDSIINYIRNRFPHLKYQEGAQADPEGKPLKMIRMNFHGILISITQVNATVYSFVATDYYETIKLILSNPESGYIFRDDLKIY